MSFGYFGVPLKEHQLRKPRQAFKKAKQYQTDMAKRKTGAVSSGYWKRSLKEDYKMTATVRFLLLILIGGAGYFISQTYSKWAAKIYVHHEVRKQQYSPTQNIHYKALINSGQYHFKNGNKAYAAAEFQRALKIAPYGSVAALGLTEILVENCINFDSYCPLTEQWVTFCEISFGTSAQTDRWNKLMHEKYSLNNPQ